MAINVAKIQLAIINSNTNTIVTSTGPVNDRLNTYTELRVIDDPSIPNTAGSPTIEDYLTLEDGSGMILKHMDQTYIITQDS